MCQIGRNIQLSKIAVWLPLDAIATLPDWPCNCPNHVEPVEDLDKNAPVVAKGCVVPGIVSKASSSEAENVPWDN